MLTELEFDDKAVVNSAKASGSILISLYCTVTTSPFLVPSN